MNRPSGKSDVHQFGTRAEEKIFVSDTTTGANVHVDPGAHAAAKQTQEQNGRDSDNKLMPLARAAVSFLIGAETTEHQQRRGEQTHWQRKYPDERNQQTDCLKHCAGAHLAIDDQREDFLEYVAEQQYKGEHRHGQQQ